MNLRLLAASLVSLALGISAQSLSAQQKKGVPLTPWGEPDLQGTYTNQTLTPLERPASLKDKAFLTKDEADALEKRSAAQRETSEDAPPRPGRCRQLQRLLDGAGHEGRRLTADVTRRRSAGRSRAAQEGSRTAPRRLRETGNRFVRLHEPLGSLHHARHPRRHFSRPATTTRIRSCSRRATS